MVNQTWCTSQHRKVSNFQWTIQGSKFTDVVRVLKLRGGDAGLRVEWLKRYSHVVLGFNKPSLAFTKEGKIFTLKGITETPELNMMDNNGLRKVLKKVGSFMGFLFFLALITETRWLFSPVCYNYLRDSWKYLVNLYDNTRKKRDRITT